MAIMEKRGPITAHADRKKAVVLVDEITPVLANERAIRLNAESNFEFSAADSVPYLEDGVDRLAIICGRQHEGLAGMPVHSKTAPNELTGEQRFEDGSDRRDGH
jgi:hypothetical protein